MPSPLVSTVITSYNKGEFLAATIESALRQAYTPHEILIVDDGSTDDTRAVAARFGDRIRYLYQENGGQASARNRGIRAARGEFIAFLDGDDRWRDDKLLRQVPLFDQRPQLAVVYSPKIPFTNSAHGPDWAHSAPTGRLRRGRVLESILVDNFVPFSAAIVRASALWRVGLFDEQRRIADDYDLWLRVAREYEFDFVDETLLGYWNGDNRIGARHGTKFEHVMKIQQDFLSRYYPDGFPNPAAVRAATAQKYAEHADWLLTIGRQWAAFRAHRSAAWLDPWCWRRWQALVRDLVPNRLIGAIKRALRFPGSLDRLARTP